MSGNPFDSVGYMRPGLDTLEREIITIDGKQYVVLEELQSKNKNRIVIVRKDGLDCLALLKSGRRWEWFAQADSCAPYEYVKNVSCMGMSGFWRQRSMSNSNCPSCVVDSRLCRMKTNTLRTKGEAQ